MNGTDLLADFRNTRSEAAFSELVRRYTNLVYSVANRRLANVSLAQEVTQLVFIRLAKAVPTLRSDAELVAWLHRTTVHVSIDLWRSESRRHAREEQAIAMQLDVTDNPGWDDLAFVLDEALNELNDADRQAVLLRFFDGKAMRDLGVVLGISEDAAKMRVSRAIDRLRTQLTTRGVTCSAAALGTLLTERSVEAAPIQFAATLAAFRFPIPAGVESTTGILGLVTQAAKHKLVTGIALSALVGASVLVILRFAHQAEPDLSTEVSRTAMAGSAPGQNQGAAVPTTLATDASAGEREPDPFVLLQTVAQVRQQISSGSMELQLSIERFQDGRRETNRLRLSALFDGPKFRWEQVGREYRYTAVGDGSAAQEARIKREGLDKAAAVRAGLLEGFEARYVTAYDGAALLTYRETDGRSSGAVIDEPNKGSVQFIFDPRCLGLRASLGVSISIENCLGYSEAKYIKLVGKESVDGVPAWHVLVKSKYDESLDFWIDAARPGRVLKLVSGRDIVLSRYEGTTAADPLPTEVSTAEYRNGSPWFTKRFTRSNAQYNLPVDPASWTLAGLGMAVGTSVVDVRIHRRIGYWTGMGLSEDLPRKRRQTETGTQPPPKMDELVAVLETDPASQDALQAAAWILLNTPDGPEVEKASAVILKEHTGDTNLVYLCKQLERVRHRCATNLLEAILANNPSAEVKAQACFILATLRKEEAMFGQNKKATAEAVKLFERVATEFARSGPTGAELARRAKPELHELRHLIIGKPAPDTQGEDLDGQRINLRDYHGQVVVLVFWCCGYSEATDHQKLLERVAGKPVALIGVSGDNDRSKARESVQKQQVSWPTIWDGRDRPIHGAWNVNKWLTTIVLDVKGVIRYRDVRGRELELAVVTLLRE